MKTLRFIALAAGLVVAGAASAHPHFTPPNQSLIGSGHMDGDRSDSSQWSKTGDDNTKLNHHEGRKDDRRERIVYRLEERREVLLREIAKLEFERARGIGNPDRIKHEIARLNEELTKVASLLRFGVSL
jgi:hypothetical protein